VPRDLLVSRFAVFGEIARAAEGRDSVAEGPRPNPESERDELDVTGDADLVGGAQRVDIRKPRSHFQPVRMLRH
jgi:hypothetical protein